MKGQDRIGELFARNRRALALRDSLGRGTATSRVRVVEGYRCEIEDGDWRLVADMGEKSGGTNEGPNPGVLERAALGTCLAMTYVMWLSYRGIGVDRLEVEVQTDYDARGYHGVGDVPPGYAEMRYFVNVESEAPAEDVLRVLDEADAHCDGLTNHSRPRDIRREVRFAAIRR